VQIPDFDDFFRHRFTIRHALSYAALTPDVVLDACDSAGFRADGGLRPPHSVTRTGVARLAKDGASAELAPVLREHALQRLPQSLKRPRGRTGGARIRSSSRPVRTRFQLACYARGSAAASARKPALSQASSTRPASAPRRKAAWRIVNRWRKKVVEVRDLHFGYGKLPIFSGLSLDIRRGQVVAILGGSGCGKSTLLKLIGGQLVPQQGSVKVEGREVHALEPTSSMRCASRWG